MTHVDRGPATDGFAVCRCGAAGVPDEPARIGPVQLAVALIRAAAAVTAAAVAALVAPDPLEPVPAVVRRG